MTAQSIEDLLQALAAGLLSGAIYGLMCVGLGLIFGVMRVINFAHGDFMMLGMYAAYYAFVSLGVQAAFGSIIGPYVAVVIAGPVLFIFGFGIHRLLISRVTGARTSQLEGEGHHAQLILTLGIALIMQNGGLMLFGSMLASIQTPLSTSAWELGPLWGDLVSIFINKSRGIAALISIAAMIVLALLIGRSRLGTALRAAADNPVAATTWASTSTGPTASPSASGRRSPGSPADCSPPTIRSIPTSGSTTSSSCTRAWCSAEWGASSAPSGAG